MFRVIDCDENLIYFQEDQYKLRHYRQQPRIHTTSKLKIVHLNIRPLRSPSHLIELRDRAAANKTEVITVAETWLNTTVTNSEVSIDINLSVLLFAKTSQSLY